MLFSLSSWLRLITELSLLKLTWLLLWSLLYLSIRIYPFCYCSSECLELFFFLIMVVFLFLFFFFFFFFLLLLLLLLLLVLLMLMLMVGTCFCSFPRCGHFCDVEDLEKNNSPQGFMKGDYQYFRWPPPKIIYRQSLPVTEVTCWKLRNQCSYASFSWSGNLPRNLRPVHSIVCWQICLTSQVCLSRKWRICTEKWQEKLHISNMILSYDMIWICICMLSYAYNGTGLYVVCTMNKSKWVQSPAPPCCPISCCAFQWIGHSGRIPFLHHRSHHLGWTSWVCYNVPK